MRKKTGEINKREKAILKFIEKQILTNGYPPSVREIGQAVGLKSTATVKRLYKKRRKKRKNIKIIKRWFRRSKRNIKQRFLYSKRIS